MAVIKQFPAGGRDLINTKTTRVKVSDAEALLPIVSESSELRRKLERALRLSIAGYCYLPDGLEHEILLVAIGE